MLEPQKKELACSPAILTRSDTCALILGQAATVEELMAPQPRSACRLPWACFSQLSWFPQGTWCTVEG